MDMMWTTGITVKKDDDGWIVTCEWRSKEVKGTITNTHNEESLSNSIDNFLEYMSKIGVKRSDEIEIMKDDLGFALYLYDYVERVSDELIDEVEKEAKNRGRMCYINE